MELYSKSGIAAVNTSGNIDDGIRLLVMVETPHETVLDDPIYCIPRLLILPPLSIKALYYKNQMSDISLADEVSKTYWINTLHISHCTEPRIAFDKTSVIHERLRPIHELYDILCRALLVQVDVVLTCPLGNPDGFPEGVMVVCEVCDEGISVNAIPIYEKTKR